MQGLMVTKTEFERAFSRHRDALDITSHGKLMRLTAKAGPCPNWQGACAIYEDRPMECRLFPFTISVVATTPRRVHITAHNRVNCPQKDHLLPDETTARGLFEAFAREAFGSDRSVHIVFERGLAGKVRVFLLKLGLRLRLLQN